MKEFKAARTQLLLSATLVVATLVLSFSTRMSSNTKHRALHPLVQMPDTNVFLSKTTVKSKGLITFTTAINNTYYMADSANKTGYIYLEAKAAKYVNEGSKRLPLNISLVLDHSGSMSGAKMQNVKEAAKFVVDNLSGEDYLSIIVYDDDVTILQEATSVTDKALIKAKIDQVRDEGSTNLSGGMLEGYEQVKKNFKKEYVNRVLLLSDGLANVGITDSAQLQKIANNKNLEHGISLSTFGVGADYNEDLMTGMAEYGSGNYYFIESPDKIPQIFERELKGLLNVVAQNVTMELEIPFGATLVDVFGYKFEQKGTKVVVNFRDVYSEETKAVLIKYHINDGVDKSLNFLAELKFDDAKTGERVSLQNDEPQTPTRDYALYRTHGNEMVYQQITLFEANRRMELAMREVDLGHYDEARVLMRQNTVYLNQMMGFVNVNKEILVMDSVNMAYNISLKDLEQKSEHDRKNIQKNSKQRNYDMKKKK